MKSWMYFVLSAGFPLTGNWHVAILSFSPAVVSWAAEVAEVGCAGNVVSAAVDALPPANWDKAARPAIPARASPALLIPSRRVRRADLSFGIEVMPAGVSQFVAGIKNPIRGAIGINQGDHRLDSMHEINK